MTSPKPLHAGAPRRRARSQAAKEQKRKILLQAALHLFTEKGFQRTSIEMITDRARESTGTFYLYFKNKVHIYRCLTREGYELLKAGMTESVSWPGMNALAKISAAIHAYYRFYREYPGYYKVMNVLHIGQPDFVADPLHVDQLNTKAVELLSFLSKIIQGGIDQGELAPVNAWEATNALWGMMDGIFIMEIRNNLDIPGVPLDDLIKQALNIVLEGLVRQRR